MSKIVRVNMTDHKIRFEDVPEDYVKWGGRGLTSSITFNEVPFRCHPLGANNKLVIAPGLVSGTNAPTSGRLSIGGKSPLTGTIKETNSGGLASQKIARLGIKCLIVEGKPEERDRCWILQIYKEGASLEPATELKGKGMYEVCQRLGENGKLAVIGIGPAGEMLMSNAGICINDMENSAGRYAGRGGMGAVMGSKGLKAVVIDDAGASGVDIVEKELFDQGRQKMVESSLSHPVTKKEGALNSYGTAVLINILNEAGGLPTRNFRTGRFEMAEEISGEKINEICRKRGGAAETGHGCHPGCIIKCSNRWARPDGSFQVSVLEYETVWALGANCGIGNLDDLADLTYLCNDIGLDTIEAGCTLAIAMEGGLIDFGDAEGAKKLLEEVRKGTPVGRIIGNGGVFTAKALGVTRVPAVKGQCMPAYDPRAVKGIGVTFATSTMGADHTAGYTICPEILSVGGKEDPLSIQKKGELSRNFQAWTAFIDSSGYCLFNALHMLDSPEGLQGMVDTCAGLLGVKWSVDDAFNLGLEVLRIERRFNEGAGFTRADDRLPEFMDHEKLPPHNVTFDVPEDDLDSVHAKV